MEVKGSWCKNTTSGSRPGRHAYTNWREYTSGAMNIAGCAITSSRESGAGSPEPAAAGPTVRLPPGVPTRASAPGAPAAGAVAAGVDANKDAGRNGEPGRGAAVAAAAMYAGPDAAPQVPGAGAVAPGTPAPTEATPPCNKAPAATGEAAKSGAEKPSIVLKITFKKITTENKS